MHLHLLPENAALLILDKKKRQVLMVPFCGEELIANKVLEEAKLEDVGLDEVSRMWLEYSRSFSKFGGKTTAYSYGQPSTSIGT